MVVISIRKIRRSWRICLCAALAGGVLGWSVANFAPAPADFVRTLKVMVGWDGAGEAFRRQRLADITADVSTYDVVMLGDSITEGGPWTDMALDGRSIANHGISGDTTLDVLARIDVTNRASPSTIFLMIGVNDLLMGRSRGFLDRMEGIVDRLSGNGRSLYIQSILLTGLDGGWPNAAIVIANDAVARLCSSKPGCTFIDLNAVLTANDRLMDEVTTDGVHLNDLGYARWSALIQDILAAPAGK